MKYKTGKAKSLDDITLDDVLQHPIWIWASDEEGEPDQDETWQKPLLDTDNITPDIFTPIITLKIKDTDRFASGEYDEQKKQLAGISVWKDDSWTDLRGLGLPEPVILIAVPRINGEENVEFICIDVKKDRAYRK